MRQTLPFDTFLDVLRDKGYGVSLHEHLAVARLLERWDRTDVSELRDALAALIGRDSEEVEGIGRLFDEICRPEPSPPPPGPQQKDTPGSFAWGWAVAAVVGVAVVALLAVGVTSVTPPRLPPPPAIFLAARFPPIPPPPDVRPDTRPDTRQAGPSARRPTVNGAAPAPPVLPRPPTSLVRGVVAQAGVACFLLAFAALWYSQTRRVTRGWLHSAWRSALAARPGPFHPTLVIRGVTWRLPRTQVEDAAVILGRIFGADIRAKDLDVAGSLRLTLRRGLLPQLVFARVRTARPIVVLEDVSHDMDLWREKVHALLGDLARQGIGLERWYFDGDPRRVSERPRGAPVPLATVIGRRPDSPVLIVGTGAGLVPVLEDPDTAWLKVVSERSRKAWVTPLVDSRFWPEALARVPVPVWPMTRLGLTQAARALAGFDAPASIRARVLAEGRVTHDEVERVKRLASLVPHPTIALLEYLRQRFAPDVPDAAIAHLLKEAGAEGLPVLRLSEQELARCIAAVREETPTLEAAVRREILAVLAGSAPPAGSAAHLRWRLAVAVQELSLAHLQGVDSAAPMADLQALRSGPIWEEVAAAVGRLPGPTTGEVASRATGALPGAARSGPPPDDGDLGRWMRKPRARPGVRELVPAIGTALVLCIGAWLLGAFPTRTFAHVPNAYRLTYLPGGTLTPPQLDLRVGDGAYPSTVDLYRDNQRLRAGLSIPSDGPLRITLPTDGAGSYYQARAALRERNLAVSNAVWAPPANLVVALIDAQPWARVTIDGGGTHLEPGATPVSVPLAPGTYRLRLENGGLTPSRDEEIVVSPGNQEFRFVMPGFDPARAAEAVLGVTPAAGQ